MGLRDKNTEYSFRANDYKYRKNYLFTKSSMLYSNFKKIICHLYSSPQAL